MTAPPPAQLPAPSQVLIPVCIPEAHDATAHTVPAGYVWQAPVPAAQAPSVPHDATP